MAVVPIALAAAAGGAAVVGAAAGGIAAIKELLIDELKDDYIIVKKIGGGCFGEVWLVKDKKSGELAAAKLLNFKLNDRKGKEVPEDGRREIEAMKKLPEHDNLARFIQYQVDEKWKKHVLVFEYYPNGTLNDFILLNNIGPQEKKVFMKGIMSAIAHIHRHRIFHLDLKADNFLLDGDNVVKVTDFGIAKTFSSSRAEVASISYYSSSGEICLPKYFCPPEHRIAESSGEVEKINQSITHKVDIYQAGCTFLAMMLETTAPWMGDKKLLVPVVKTKKGTIKELADVILDEMDEQIEKLFDQIQDESLRATIREMISEKPDERPAAEDVKIV